MPQFYGTTGNDRINGSIYNDTIEGYAGDDVIVGNAGFDLIYGGAGGDFVSGGDGDDAVVGGSENDEVYGGNGADWIEGNDGNDYLVGDYGSSDGYGSDILIGGNGNDVLKSGNPQYFGYSIPPYVSNLSSEIDRFYGGSGVDRFVMDSDYIGSGYFAVEDWQPGETIDLKSEGGVGNYFIRNDRNLRGSSAPDTIIYNNRSYSNYSAGDIVGVVVDQAIGSASWSSVFV